MLLPRYSIRTILLVTAASAVVFLIAAQAFQGREWAAGISIGLLVLCVAVAVQAVMFALVWGFAMLIRTGRNRRAAPVGPPRRSPISPSADPSSTKHSAEPE